MWTGYDEVDWRIDSDMDGIVTIDEIQKLYRFKDLTDATRMYEYLSQDLDAGAPLGFDTISQKSKLHREADNLWYQNTWNVT